eukprot:CAMPEP_0194363910 /NCGR_PEP_ID=MMETSP0174-20130528/11780_1 /TAXON_ID=216777 /ORGANISM="Proboscia alata, Strain PI-D3" /LENGTH=328 /DNA_ID=CAMNT_0039137633 /DNA_START=254 /DNA_END=1240 /DNA_ORIENTATION=-
MKTSDASIALNTSRNSTLFVPDNVDFDTNPMCEAVSIEREQECHEIPTEPSPRTIYSCWNQKQFIDWFTMHNRYVSDAKLFDSEKRNYERPVLMLIGDSITESFLGTSYGVETERTKSSYGEEAFRYFQTLLGNKYETIVNAISGDQVQHVLWRLQNGELPQSASSNNQAIFVILIGTNNLGNGHLPNPTAQGILELTKELLIQTKGKIVLLQVLPRGDGSKILPKLCPPRCTEDEKPFQSFFPAVRKVNDKLQNAMSTGDETIKMAYISKRLALIDCGEAFLVSGDSGMPDVNATLMPDLLHPYELGLKIMADCIAKEVEAQRLAGG